MTDVRTTMVSMRLPDDMVEEVDRRAKDLGLTRSKWFTNMTKWCLENTYTIESRGGVTND